MTGDPLIRLDAVAHRYRDTVALSDISLNLPAGRMLGLIGPDGVGKSTLLGLIAGARRIQAGTVEVLGGDMAERRHRAAVCGRIAYMPQGLGTNLYMDLTVAENLAFFSRLFAQGRSERAARITDLLAATGLAPFAARPAGKLSGGMKQKLGLCCALIHDPDLLVLDEPTTGVDPLSRRQFWSLIGRIRNQRPGMTVIVATAYMEEAEDFDWLVAMDAGRILAAGTPEELKAAGSAETLEQAFVALMTGVPGAARTRLQIPPHQRRDGKPAIVAQSLTRRFGSFTAVDRVSFTIERGEIFGFLGSNGCGKTTTMKMLTGLLPPSEGEARLFGVPTKSHGLGIRKRVGYMSQSFSLYSELTVRQNLDLHARLFHLSRSQVKPRIEALLAQFDLVEEADTLAAALPLGVRQRLSLAVAIIHEPEVLILDEPTSGVDPLARDAFWALLIDLARNQGVTIFVSTHFMNEAERCDRISLMHAGQVLVTDTPSALIRARGATSLDQAFIAYLEEASGETAGPHQTGNSPAEHKDTKASAAGRGFDRRRALAYSLRETMEILRDPIRLAFALAGTVILMLVFGYGISTDVERLTYAALDHDRSPQSRAYLEAFRGSRYFDERPPLLSQPEMDRRLRSADITLALELPPGFGKDILRGRRPVVAAWIDGAMPFRAETIRDYVQGVHLHHLGALARGDVDGLTGPVSGLALGSPQDTLPVALESRFRYNQDFKSVFAMVPSNIALLLVFIPAILMALAIVREKELGSINNLYVTPVTRLEFLLGKQLPYVALGMINFLLLVALAIWLFGVPLKGSFPALALAALLYVTATTGLGLLISTFTNTQVAALFGTAIATTLPAIQFSGMLQPVASLDGAAALIGQAYPTTHFMKVSVGTFTKALGFADLGGELLALAATIPVLTVLALLLLKEQAR